MPSIKPPLIRLSFVLIAFVLTVSSISANNNNDNKSIRINPEFRISRESNGSVLVSSRNPRNTSVRHEFNDFYADLLIAAYRKQALSVITGNLRKKYNLTEDECRREIKHALNVLAEWNIVLREDVLALP
jgi:hypothetical protein